MKFISYALVFLFLACPVWAAGEAGSAQDISSHLESLSRRHPIMVAKHHGKKKKHKHKGKKKKHKHKSGSSHTDSTSAPYPAGSPPPADPYTPPPPSDTTPPPANP